MKQSQAFYQNRKLIKDLKNDNVKFKPKVEDVEFWFEVLNEQLFGNKLQMFGSVKISRKKHFHALFHYSPRKENKPTSLWMNNSFDSKKLWVEILAHEMIHLFQYTYNEPLGHGPSFWAWRDNFNFKGLELHKVA